MIQLAHAPRHAARPVYYLGDETASSPATSAGIVTLLEPLTAAVLGVTVFGESLGAAGWMGAVLLLAALIRLTAGRSRAT